MLIKGKQAHPTKETMGYTPFHGVKTRANRLFIPLKEKILTGLQDLSGFITQHVSRFILYRNSSLPFVHRVSNVLLHFSEQIS